MNRNSRAIRTSVLFLALALGSAACAPATVQRAPARIDVQEAWGFTITEDADISGAARVDYDRALSLLQQGHLAEGAALLKTVADAAPDLSAPLVDLGVAYHRMGDLEAAEAALVRALEANPRHPTALNELGIVYRKTGRFAEARKQYEAALAIYPGFHFARRNLAVLCELYLADLDCALRNYEAYMTTVHDDDEVAVWLKNLNYRMDRGE